MIECVRYWAAVPVEDAGELLDNGLMLPVTEDKAVLWRGDCGCGRVWLKWGYPFPGELIAGVAVREQ